MIPAYLAYGGMVISILGIFAIPPRDSRKLPTLKQMRRNESVQAMRNRHARLANRWSVR